MIKTLASIAGGVGSTHSLGAKISHATQPKKNKHQNVKQNQYCNKY